MIWHALDQWVRRTIMFIIIIIIFIILAIINIAIIIQPVSYTHLTLPTILLV